MSKRSAFTAFKPSFSTLGFGWPPALFEEAFNVGATELSRTLDGVTGTKASTEGVVGVGIERSLRFGHIPEASSGIPAELSGAAPFRLTVTFTDKEELESVKLVLFLLNPRMILARDMFLPAQRSINGQFAALTKNAEPCGIMLLADPDEPPKKRWDALSDGLPQGAISEVPPGAKPHNEETLVARFDLSVEWKNDFLGAGSADLFGRTVGVPDASLPGNISTMALRLFSPAYLNTFSALMNASRSFALELKDVVIDGPKIILKAPTDPKTRDLYNTALAEFNLGHDFKGLLFEGIEAHFLDDRQYGQTRPNLFLSLTAVSFAGGGVSGSSWYTSIDASVTATGEEGYLHLLSELRLRASLADNEISHFTLSGTFKALPHPYAWLSGHKAVLSLRNEDWTDAHGAKHKGSAIDLRLESTGNAVLTTLTPNAPVPMDSKLFSAVAVALTLAPIVLASNPVNAPDGVHPPNEKTRGYFVPIRGMQGLAQLYGSLTLGWFFENAVTIDELRVVGVRLQRQPAAVNDPNLDPDVYQTALLFDYETDYKIRLEDAKIETTRALTARIDGTGFCISGSDVQWVQVPSGIRELSVADPSLWELGTLGKILKIADMSIRRVPEKQLRGLNPKTLGHLGHFFGKCSKMFAHVRRCTAQKEFSHDAQVASGWPRVSTVPRVTGAG